MEPNHKTENARQKTTSKVEFENGTDLRIPDGGWGWVVCFAGFMNHFTTAGITSSNGIILLGLIDRYNATVAETALIGSLLIGSIMCAGPLALGLLTFNASYRQVIMLGGLVASISTFVSAFASRIEVLFVTYGIITGSTVGMSYFAGNTIVGSYFSKKRSIAVGIATSGGGCGTIALTYLIEQSITFYGMPGTYMLISGVILNFLVYGALCQPLKPQTHKTGGTDNGLKQNAISVLQTETMVQNEDNINVIYTLTKNSETYGELEISSHKKAIRTNKCQRLRLTLFNPTVFKNHCMQLLFINYFFWSAVEIALIYLPAKAVDVGLSREDGAWIMSLYGIGLTIGEISSGFLIDLFHIPASLILLSSLLVIFISLIVFTLCYSFSSFAICTLFISISNGISCSLRIVFVASILGVGDLNKGYSPLSITIGFGYIIYSYMCGALFNASQSFDVVFYFAAANLFISFLVSCGISYMQIKGKFRE